jgi:hypothetical protein
MRNKSVIFVFLPLLFFLLCCASNVRTPESFALIDDVSKGAASGYEIIEIDGVNVKRREHTSMVTVVPFAIVEPGHKILKLRKRDLFKKIDGPEYLSISVNVEAGKLYRLKRQNSTVFLVEDEK